MNTSKYPVVILHGWNLSGSAFAKTTSAFQKKGYIVFAPDLPGFGTTPPPDRPYDVSDYAEYIYHYLQGKRIRRCFLVGHSFGGRISLILAAQHPEIIAGIILTGTPGFSPVPKGKVLFFVTLAKIGKILFSIPPFTIFENIARKFLYKAARTKDFYHTKGVMRATFQKVIKQNLLPFMKQITIPTLLIWGKNDPITPVWIGEKMKRAIPKAQLIVIENERHMVPVDNPDQFVGNVDSFVKKVVTKEK